MRDGRDTVIPASAIASALVDALSRVITIGERISDGAPYAEQYQDLYAAAYEAQQIATDLENDLAAVKTKFIR
jgi:hypothetical protein